MDFGAHQNLKWLYGQIRTLNAVWIPEENSVCVLLIHKKVEVLSVDHKCLRMPILHPSIDPNPKNVCVTKWSPNPWRLKPKSNPICSQETDLFLVIFKCLLVSSVAKYLWCVLPESETAVKCTRGNCNHFDSPLQSMRVLWCAPIDLEGLSVF